MLEALANLSPVSLPILPCLLRGAAWQRQDSPGPPGPEDPFAALVARLRLAPELIACARDSVVEEFRLNADQVSVLDRCIQWLEPSSKTPPSPVVLVHGAFGAGKSILLVALLVFFHKLLQPLDPHCRVRVLVAALTNVAVDGVLSSLLHRGYSFFVRVGSARKIAANVLRHTVHSSHGSRGVEESHRQAKADVDAKLKAAVAHGAEEEVRSLRETLAEMERERGQERKRRLMAMRVVGVTCAASTFEVLDGSTFPIVLLDEASQMIEPASLVPLTRFHCQRLIAVGDPKQLPPMLQEVEGASGSIATVGPLSKALFERLSNAGVPTVLLRTQYRMHPTLVALPNRLFYDGLLESGVGPEERPPLVLPRATDVDERPLPPLCFVNVPHGQEQRERTYAGGSHGGSYGGSSAGGDKGLSWVNAAEVAAVVAIVSALLRKGVPPTSIGLITMYRPQWQRLRGEMSRVMVQMEADEQRQRQLQQRLATGQGSVVVDDLHVLPDADCAAAGVGVSGAGVQVNTVDSFQGGEKDVVVFSCVKTSMSDFMDNARRINVALTRARHHLIVVGHQPTLLQSPLWKAIVTHVSCKLPGCFYASPHLLVAQVERGRLNAMAVRVSEKEDSAQVRASRANTAGRKRGRGEKAKRGSNKSARSDEGHTTAVEGEGEAAAEALQAQRRQAATESDSEEEFHPTSPGEDEGAASQAEASIASSLPPSSPSHPSSPPPPSADEEVALTAPQAEAKAPAESADDEETIDILQLLRDDEAAEKERKKREDGYSSAEPSSAEEEAGHQPPASPTPPTSPPAGKAEEASAERARQLRRIPELDEDEEITGAQDSAPVDVFDFP